MDNATFHRKAKLKELADNACCKLLFLPPYSPDLNPIEKHWAWLKRKLRDILKSYEVFMDALQDCF
jgi:transposase